MRTKLLLLAGAAAAVLGFAGSAQALTYTQTVAFGPAVTDFNGTGVGAGSVLYFDNADGSVLNSITFSSSYGFQSAITISNAAQEASTGDVFTRSASQFSAGTDAATAALNGLVNTAGSATIGAATLSPAAFILNGTDQSYSVAAGGSQTVQSNAATVNNGPVIDSNAADVAAFVNTGGGNLAILFNTLTGIGSFSTGGNTTKVQNTIATGTLTITYNYDAAPPPPPPTNVPEPASMLVLGTGLVGLGLARRFRRA